GIWIFGQVCHCKFPEVHAWLQRDFDNTPNHRLGFLDNIWRSKKPHSISKPDEVLFVAAELEAAAQVRFEKQLRRAHNKVRVDAFALCRLTRDALLPILVSLSVDRGG